MVKCYPSKYPSKDKKGITNAFQKLLDEFYCKPNKICLDKGSRFFDKSILFAK